MNRIDSRADVAVTAVLGPGCVVEPFASIGDGVILGEGVFVASGARVLAGTIENDVRIGPNAVVAAANVCACATIGANAAIVGEVVVGQHAVISDGAVVTRSVPPNAVVAGNPAVIVRYVGSGEPCTGGLAAEMSAAAIGQPSRVRGVVLHRLRVVHDMRGNLTVGEFAREIPFVPKRYFMVLDVPSSEVRGEHAHRRCEQFLVCVRGACSVVADVGDAREEFRLDAPWLGLFLPPMTWGIQYKYTHDAVLLVFASELYDPGDYIRDYGEFLRLAAESTAGVLPAARVAHLPSRS